MKLSSVLRCALVAGALGLLGLSSASALSPDRTRNFVTRELNEQVVQTVRVTINYNDPLIGSGSPLNVALPANAYILSIDADVTTAFNAGTTNVVTLGATQASANEILASGITAGTTGIYHLTSAAGLGVAVTGNPTYQTVSGGSIRDCPGATSCNGVPIWAKYAQTGTAATAGSVTIVITYVPNLDQ